MNADLRYVDTPHFVNLQGNGHCLADLCDVLHCDYIAEEIMAEKGKGVDLYARHAPCEPKKEAAIKKKCRVRFQP